MGRKFLLCMSLIIISICCFCGCAQVEFLRTVDDYEVITDKLVVTLDEAKLNKRNVSIETVTAELNNDFIIFRQYVDTWIDSFYEYPELQEMLDKGIYCESTFVKRNELSIMVQFSDWDCFAVFYGLIDIKDCEYSRAMEDIGPFITKIINGEFEKENIGIFLYKYSVVNDVGIINKIRDNGYIVDGINTDYVEKYQNLTKYSLDDISMSQVFVYPDDRIYSNATYSDLVGDLTMLSWDLTDSGEGFQMSIYKIAPRTVSWYTLAIVVSVVVIVSIIIYIRTHAQSQICVKITKQDVENNEK